MSVRVKPPVRVGDLERGRQEENQRLISYLIEKGILRQSMFGDSLVARMVDTPDDDKLWPIIDLPADLGLNDE